MGVSDKYFGVATATGVAFDIAKETRFGGAAGVGVEFGFAPRWSVAIEYDHGFMGNRSLVFNSLNPGVSGVFSRTERIHQDVDIATARVNYTWGGPVVAKY